MLDAKIEAIAKKVVHAGFRVHDELGPGLLESVYELCFCHELTKAGLRFERQRAVPIVYDGLKFEAALKVDVLVEGVIVIELKAVDVLLPVHRAQLLSYLRLTRCPLGFLVNFHVPLFKQGVQRFILDQVLRPERNTHTESPFVPSRLRGENPQGSPATRHGMPENPP